MVWLQTPLLHINHCNIDLKYFTTPYIDDTHFLSLSLAKLCVSDISKALLLADVAEAQFSAQERHVCELFHSIHYHE